MPSVYRIGHTEDNLIVILARYVRATAEQCTRHSYSRDSLSYVRKRLAGLAAAQYVEKHRGFSQNGKPPNVYSPTMQGWRYAQEHHGMPIPTRWRPSEAQITDFRDYLHDLAITDFGIAVERFCREAGQLVRMARFTHDRFLPQTKVLLPTGKHRALRLDAFIDLRIRRESGTKQRCFLLELDRGTHYEKALTEKMLAQISYVEGGHYASYFGTQSLSYLWVCPGKPERVRQLIKLTEKTLHEHKAGDFAPIFLFTAEDPATVDPVTLFTSDCWYVPFQPAPVTLLAFTPPGKSVSLNRSRYLPQGDYDRFLMATGEQLPHVAAELDME
jgi:hypothetical protein